MSSRSGSKIDPAPIVRAHLATLVDSRTGRRRGRDLVEQFALPVLVGLIVGFVGVRISATTGAAILTLAGLFAAFLFQLIIQLLDRAASWADDQPLPGTITSRYADLLGELSANAAYTSLAAALTSSVSLAVIISATGWPERLLSATTIALLVHLGTTLLLVTRRVFLLTSSKLRDARTAAHRENT